MLSDHVQHVVHVVFGLGEVRKHIQADQIGLELLSKFLDTNLCSKFGWLLEGV